jgi:uncharacterized protein YcnI
MPRLALRVGTVAATVLVSIGVFASAAAAHVTVNPNTAYKGGYTKLTFRVPTEKDNASTTKLQVFFPADAPLAYVGVKPHAGWTYTITKQKLAKPIKSDDGDVTEGVAEIAWTANDKVGIKPSEFDEFDVSVGPLPDVATMTFKALQTYSNGDVVRWIEMKGADGKDPEHPAPVLTLTARSTASPIPSPSSAGAAVTAANDSGTGATPSNTLPIVLAVIALLVALVAAGVALAGRKRGSTPTTS